MRIAQVYARFGVGGIESYIQNISQIIGDHGNDCFVVIPSGVYAPGVLRPEPYSERFSVYAPAQFTSVPAVMRKLRRLRLDILHVNSYWLYPFTNILLGMGKKLAKGVVVTPHMNPIARKAWLTGLSASRQLPLSLYHSRIGPALLRRADAIIALTRAEEDIYRKWGMRNVHLIPLGVDANLYNPSNDGRMAREIFHLGEKRIVLFIGRLLPYKGVEYLLEAAKILSSQIDDVLFLIVGDGPHRDYLVRLSEGLGVSDFVTFTGYVPGPLLPKLYAASDVLVMPSLGEPFGMVLLEAMASGKPTIATRGGGVPEVVTKETTILVEERDQLALAKAIMMVLSDPPMAVRMGKAGRELVEERYDWGIVARRVMEIYEGVVRRCPVETEPPMTTCALAKR